MLYIYKDFPRKFRHRNAKLWWDIKKYIFTICIFINSELATGIETECNDECIVWVRLKRDFFGFNNDKYECQL